MIGWINKLVHSYTGRDNNNIILRVLVYISLRYEHNPIIQAPSERFWFVHDTAINMHRRVAE